jgi:hypothetical protein
MQASMLSIPHGIHCGKIGVPGSVCTRISIPNGITCGRTSVPHPRSSSSKISVPNPVRLVLDSAIRSWQSADASK